MTKTLRKKWEELLRGWRQNRELRRGSGLKSDPIEGNDGLVGRVKAQTFPNAAKRWLDARRAHDAPKIMDVYKLTIDHLKKHFGGGPPIRHFAGRHRKLPG